MTGRTRVVKAVLLAAVLLVVSGAAYPSQPLATIVADQSAAFKPFVVDKAEMERAMRWGQDAASKGMSLADALAPWRITIRRSGEYVVAMTPAEQAAELGFAAGQQYLSEDTIQEKLADLADRRYAVALCVVLQSMPHFSKSSYTETAGGSRITRAAPANVHDAKFLLDAGPRQLPGVSADEDFSGDETVRTNPYGLRYQAKQFEVRLLPALSEHTHLTSTYPGYGATYIVRWSFVGEKGEPAFGTSPKSLRLLILTPDQKREVNIDFTTLGVLRRN